MICHNIHIPPSIYKYNLQLKFPEQLYNHLKGKFLDTADHSTFFAPGAIFLQLSFSLFIWKHIQNEKCPFSRAYRILSFNANSSVVTTLLSSLLLFFFFHIYIYGRVLNNSFRIQTATFATHYFSFHFIYFPVKRSQNEKKNENAMEEGPT